MKREYNAEPFQDRSFMLMSKHRSISSQPMFQNSYSQSSFTFPTVSNQNPMIPAAELFPAAVINPSPCANQAPRTNIPHPLDKTKYIACITNTKFEIMDCPSGLFYESTTDTCEEPLRPLTLCERENPCLNGGQCYEATPNTVKCTCRGAWTGERCETPVSSCASNPCGDGNQCHTLIATNYPQDYICFCEGSQSYGLSCDRNTVPNPCLGARIDPRQTYFPFAFSTHGYIQCSSEEMFVFACAGGLVWDQAEQICNHELILTPTATITESIVPVTSYSTLPQSNSYGQSTNGFLDMKVGRTFGSQHRNLDGYSTPGESRRLTHLLTRNEAPISFGSYGSAPSMPSPRHVSRTFTPQNSYGDVAERLIVKEVPQVTVSNYQTERLTPRVMKSSSYQALETPRLVEKSSSY